MTEAPDRQGAASTARATLRAPDLVGLLGILVCGFLLRLADLRTGPVWMDEAASLGIGGLPLGSLLGEFAWIEASPPGYYLVAWLSVRLFGPDIEALRLISALAGALVAAPVFLMLAARGERLAAWLAAGFLAVAASLVRVSVDGRCYALLTLGLALALWAAVRLAEATRAGRGVAPTAVVLGVALAALLWLHGTAVIHVLALNGAVLAAAGRRGVPAALRGLVLADAVALLLALLPVLANLAHTAQSDDFVVRWIAVPGLADTVMLYARVLVAPWQAPFSPLSALLLSGAVLLALRAALAAQTPALVAAAALLAIGGLTFPLLSQWRPVMLDRTVTPLLVPLAVLVGAGLARLPRRARVPTGLLVIALQTYGALSLFQEPGRIREDWHGLVRQHAAVARPDEPVLFADSVFNAIAFEHAARRLGLPVPQMAVLPAGSALEQASARHLATHLIRGPEALCAAIGRREGAWMVWRPLPATVADDPGFTSTAALAAALAAAGGQAHPEQAVLGLVLQPWQGPLCAGPPAGG